jgi:hypothetical protein
MCILTRCSKIEAGVVFSTCYQGRGSGSGSGFNDFVDRIRIGNPDPGSGSGPRGKKMKKNKYGTFLVDFIYFYN